MNRSGNSRLMQHPSSGRWRGISILMIVMSLMLAYSLRFTPTAHGEQSALASDPIVFLYAESTPPKEPGLLFAAWEDGTVLMPGSPSTPGKDLRIARLRDGSESLIKLLRDDGIVDLDAQAYRVPSASGLLFGLQLDGSVKFHSWDERIIRNYGANAKPSEQYREFVKAWYMMRITLVSVWLTDERPLADTDLVNGAFRGYVVETPYKTEWLQERRGRRPR